MDKELGWLTEKPEMETSMKHGVVHKIGEPARIYYDGREPEYWVNGVQIDDWCKENAIDLPNASEQDWQLIKIKFGEPKPFYFEIEKTSVPAKTHSISFGNYTVEEQEIESYMDIDVLSELSKHMIETLSEEELKAVLGKGDE